MTTMLSVERGVDWAAARNARVSVARPAPKERVSRDDFCMELWFWTSVTAGSSDANETGHTSVARHSGYNKGARAASA